MGERGIRQLWSWARTTQRAHFHRRTIGHASFHMSGKSTSLARKSHEIPASDPLEPAYSIAREPNPSLIDRKQRLTLLVHPMANVSCMILALDPYIYTTGRWLKQDVLERESRYIRFDFAALCQKVVKVCRGADRVIRYEKKEGGFNRSFIFIMDSGEQIVARLPTCIAGPPRLTTNSEVATMTYSKPYLLRWLDMQSTC